MPSFPARLPYRTALIAAVTTLLGACSAAERLANIGQEPQFQPIDNPTLRPEYRPVSMPMPSAEPVTFQPNSLWRTGARAFFKDQRAKRVGDLLTVVINIADEADMENRTLRERENEDSLSLAGIYGFESKLGEIFPDEIDPGNVLDIEGELENDGFGEIEREETINLRLAAVVTQVLPNGNMVIAGTQEVRVNFELRALHIQGIVRPEDIEADNTISHDKIAEARIDYGGRGQIHDVQQPRYGSQLLDIISPF